MDKKFNIYYLDYDSKPFSQKGYDAARVGRFVSYALSMGFEITGIIDKEKDQ